MNARWTSHGSSFVFRCRYGIVVLATTMACSCTTLRSTTRLADDDLEQVSREMAQSLAASDFLAQRRPDAPPVAIVIDHVENLSSDVLTVSEQWMLVARVRSALPIRTMAETKNVHFLLPPERWKMLVDAGYVAPEAAATPLHRATHLMSARLRSLHRAGARIHKVTDVRAEVYSFAFQIVALPSRELAWADTFEFKREARGIVID